MFGSFLLLHSIRKLKSTPIKITSTNKFQPHIWLAWLQWIGNWNLYVCIFWENTYDYKLHTYLAWIKLVQESCTVLAKWFVHQVNSFVNAPRKARPKVTSRLWITILKWFNPMSGLTPFTSWNWEVSLICDIFSNNRKI